MKTAQSYAYGTPSANGQYGHLTVLSGLLSLFLISCASVDTSRPGEYVRLQERAGDRWSVSKSQDTDRIHVSRGEKTAILTAGISGYLLNGNWHEFQHVPAYQNGSLHLAASDLHRLRNRLERSEPDSTPSPDSPEEDPPRDDRFRVVIDPGHGGDHTGARGVRGTLEKDLNLMIARRVRNQLKEHGIRTWLTRKSDREFSSNLEQDLDRRVEIAHEKNADLFLSIHSNAARASSAHGVEVFVSTDRDRRETIQQLRRWDQRAPASEDGSLPAAAQYKKHRRKSFRLARHVENQLESVAPTGSRGVKEKSLHVLRNAPCPSVLVETGFMTNPREARLLGRTSYRRKLAGAISDAVRQYHRLYASQ